MCSDHFAPWNERQGHSGFAWSWLGAALADDRPAVRRGQRARPALPPGDRRPGDRDPRRDVPGPVLGRAGHRRGDERAHHRRTAGRARTLRDARLRECVDVIRALLAGEEVSHDGLVTVDRARIWTLPEQQPRADRARRSPPRPPRGAPSWADGLVTVNQPHDTPARGDRRLPRRRRPRARSPSRCTCPGTPTEDEALAIAHDQWRSNVFPPPLCWDLDTPQAFDQASAHVTPEAVREAVRVSSDLGQHAAWLAEYVELGFDEIYLHHVRQEQTAFLDAFGEHVLPQLDAPGPAVAVTRRPTSRAAVPSPAARGAAHADHRHR